MSEQNTPEADTPTRRKTEGSGSSRSPLMLTLLAVAIVGWGTVLWLAVSRSSLQTELTQQLTEEREAREEIQGSLAALEAASVELTDLQAEAGRRQDALATLDLERESAQQAHDAELAQLTEQIAARRRSFEVQLAEVTDIGAAARGQASAAEDRLGRLSSEVADRQRNLDQLRSGVLQTSQRLMTQQATVGLAAARATEQTRRLADIGDRVETVRAQEAEAQSRLATLTAEAADLTNQLAEAERRTQRAREAEASRQEQLLMAQSETSRLRVERDALAAAAQALQERRELLRADVDAAQEQRQRVQEQVTELTATLAERSEELQGLEARITELQQRGAGLADGAAGSTAPQGQASTSSGGSDERSEQEAIPPGQYHSGPLTVAFEADGTFRMENRDRSESVAGRYRLDEGVITLDEMSGDIGSVRFPMQCGVEPAENGFRFTARDGDCSELAGTAFQAGNGSQ